MATARKVHLIRHAQSLYNAEMRSKKNWVNPTFWKKGFDPGIVDPSLSEKGLEQIESEKELVYSLGKPDFILVSPLRRALMTARGLWPDAKMVSCPQAREIAKTLGDCGSHPAKLKLEFPNVDFDMCSEDWWKGTDTPEIPKHWAGETPAFVAERIEQWKQIILGLPPEYENIFCVGHSNFFKVVTREVKMENVGIITVLIHPDLQVEIVENHRSTSRMDPLYQAANAATNASTDVANKMASSLTANYSKYVANRSKSTPGQNTDASRSSGSDDDADAKQVQRRGLSGKFLQNINKLSIMKRSHSTTASPEFVTPGATPTGSPWQTPRNPVNDPQNEPKSAGLNDPVEVPNPIKFLDPALNSSANNNQSEFDLINLDDWIQPTSLVSSPIEPIPGSTPPPQPNPLSDPVLTPSPVPISVDNNILDLMEPIEPSFDPCPGTRPFEPNLLSSPLLEPTNNFVSTSSTGNNLLNTADRTTIPNSAACSATPSPFDDLLDWNEPSVDPTTGQK